MNEDHERRQVEARLKRLAPIVGVQRDLKLEGVEIKVVRALNLLAQYCEEDRARLKLRARNGWLA